MAGTGSPLQLLAAFATRTRVPKAEGAISNYDEIEATLALLEGLDLRGWIITGDAKFTQKALVAKTIEKQGDYVLTAKPTSPPCGTILPACSMIRRSSPKRLPLIQERQPTPEADAKLEEIHLRDASAASPGKLKQGKETLAYRLRLFSLDRWKLWRRLTLDRGWRGPHGERLDGTNNATERSIGWRVKERYRPMRGYKRRESVLNVSRLIAWAGNLLEAGGANLAAVIA